MECLLERSIRRGEPVRRVGYGQRGGESTCRNTHTHIHIQLSACDRFRVEELREAYRRSQRAAGVSESKVPHLLHINVVVEVDQVSSLLLSLSLSPGGGRTQGLDGGVGGGGGGTSRLGGGQGAAGAHRNWTHVSMSWGRGGESHKPKKTSRWNPSRSLKSLFYLNPGWCRQVGQFSWARCCLTDASFCLRSTHTCTPETHALTGVVVMDFTTGTSNTIYRSFHKIGAVKNGQCAYRLKTTVGRPLTTLDELGKV